MPATDNPQPLLGQTIDLRRTIDRALADRLVRRAALLPPADRALVEAVFRDSLPLTRVADIARRNASPPLSPADHAGRLRQHRSLRRRLRRITHRLTCPQFDFVAAEADGWPPMRREIATEWAIQGRSLRDIARRLNLSVHLVRAQVLAVEALCREAARTRAA